MKVGLLGGALLALGGVGLALYPTRDLATPSSPLLVLEPRDFQIIVALAGRIVTAKAADPVAIAHGVDRAMVAMVPEAQADIRKIVGLFENALPGLLLDGRFRPFTHLSPSAQDAVLESWRTSHMALRRVGYQVLRKLIVAAYYMDEKSWPPLAYAPPTGLSAMAYDDSKAGTPEWISGQRSDGQGSEGSP